MAGVRTTGLGCCTERMCELLGLGSTIDVSASVKLHFRGEENPGCL